MKNILLLLCCAFFLSSCGIHSREEKERGCLNINDETYILTSTGIYLKLIPTESGILTDTVKYSNVPEKVLNSIKKNQIYSGEYKVIEEENYIVGDLFYWILLILAVIAILELFF